MRLMLVLVAVLGAACGGDDSPGDPHALTSCTSSWNMPASRCEAACASMPAENGSACGGCLKTFTSDGVIGCCVASVGDPSNGSDDRVVFQECP